VGDCLKFRITRFAPPHLDALQYEINVGLLAVQHAFANHHNQEVDRERDKTRSATQSGRARGSREEPVFAAVKVYRQISCEHYAEERDQE